MKKICYIIPYFGKLPKGFEMWLLSCSKNDTIDWILYTDDKTEYKYPKNVKVKYCNYEDIKNKIQNNFNFKVCINRPWKLCEFRPAYGEIFKDDLREYDFWGHCDMDLIWGDIRKFITDDILNKYEKIGFQGHSTIYKNIDEVNSRYRTIVPGKINYKQAFTSEEGFCFDETGICDIYDYLKIPYYKGTNFAHLDRFTNSFFLGHLPESDTYKNNRQVFCWKDGKLLRYYLYDKKVFEEEFMYLHLFSRPISYRIDKYNEKETYVIYPDVVKRIDKEKINYNFINKKGKCGALRFYIKVAYFNRKKLTLKKIIYNLRKKSSLVKSRGYK